MAATSSVWIDILARDKASKDLAKVGAKLAAVAATVKVFGVDSVKAYAEAEKSQLKLQDAFKRFPKLADSSYDSLVDYNSALQSKTRFDDDAIASAQALLAKFDLTGKQLKEVTPLVLDYAAATGQDAETAANQLGKALLGNTRALKSIGIDYTVTGDRAADFAAIQDLVSQKVGGFAEKEGKTAAGQLAILQNQFGDLQEGIGEALAPALSALVGVSTKALGVFNALPKPVKSSAVILGAMGAAALVVVPKMLALKKQLEGINISTANMARGAKAAKVAIAALAAGQITSAISGDRAAKSYEALSSSTDELGRAVGNVFNPSNAERVGSTLAAITTGLVGVQTQVEADTEALGAYDAEMARLATSGATAQASKMWADLTKAAGDHGISIDMLKQKFPQYTSAIGGATGAIGEFGDATEDTTDAVDDLYDSLMKFNDVFIDSEQAAINARDAQRDLKAALKESNGEIGTGTAKADAAKSAALKFASAVDDQAQAMAAAKKPNKDIAALYDTQRQNLYNTLVQMGLAKDKAKAYSDSLLKIPDDIKTQLTLKVNAFVRTRIAGEGSYGGITKAAGGWINGRAGAASGATITVGERGPELLVMSPHGNGGRVVPHSRTIAEQPKQAAQTINININGPVTDPVAASRWIRDAVIAGRRAGVSF